MFALQGFTGAHPVFLFSSWLNENPQRTPFSNHLVAFSEVRETYRKRFKSARILHPMLRFATWVCGLDVVLVFGHPSAGRRILPASGRLNTRFSHFPDLPGRQSCLFAWATAMDLWGKPLNLLLAIAHYMYL